MENKLIIKNADNKGLFLIDTSPTCFNHCIENITETDISKNERICLLDCYVKMSYSYSNYFKINN
jgi:hypothetical protein